MSDSEQQARAAALKSLARRDHSRREIETVLQRRGYAPAVIRKTLEYLNAQLYLDDRRFAENWARGQLAKKNIGGQLLERELVERKGVSEKLAREVVGGLLDGADETETVRVLARRKLAQLKKLDPAVKRRRAAAYLARRGFDPDIIERALDNLAGE